MNTKLTRNKIGIIGGAGPEAGVLLFNNIISNYQKRGKWEDHEFPLITLLNIPFSNMLDTASAMVTEELQEALTSLGHQDKIVIACNTLHVHLPKKVPAHFISVVDASVKKMRTMGIKKALFLGTPTSTTHKLYEGHTIDILYPSMANQILIKQQIINILKNEHVALASNVIDQVIAESIEQELFDAVILGCTELSIPYQRYGIKNNNNIPIIDTIHILSEELAI